MPRSSDSESEKSSSSSSASSRSASHSRRSSPSKKSRSSRSAPKSKSRSNSPSPPPSPPARDSTPPPARAPEPRPAEGGDVAALHAAIVAENLSAVERILARTLDSHASLLAETAPSPPESPPAAKKGTLKPSIVGRLPLPAVAAAHGVLPIASALVAAALAAGPPAAPAVFAAAATLAEEGGDRTLLVLLAAGCDPAAARAEDGATLLHILCARKPPPVALIQRLCRLSRVDVNAVDAEGRSPLYRLAEAAGTSPTEIGPVRASATALLAAGADAELAGPGGVPAAVTGSYVLRDVLCLGLPSRRRAAPQMPPSKVRELDSISPPAKLPAVIPPPGGDAPTPSVRGGAGRRLTPEETAAMAERLWRKDAADRAAARAVRVEKAAADDVAKVPRRRLTKEEEAGVGARLHDEAMGKAKETAAKLEARYLADTGRKAAPPLSAADQRASVGRLYDEAIARQAETSQTLHARYVASAPRHVLTPDEMGAAAARLCYDPQAKQAETMRRLMSQYAPPPAPARRARRAGGPGDTV